jgi:SAM-dependent methyltransferase
MRESDKAFVGSIPAIYDRYLGPLIFETHAADLAGRVADLRAGTVLETAAGTGIVTRALTRALPVNVEIIATDLNPAMLDHAASRSTARNLTWRPADAQSLPFEDARFEAVLCQFGVMFFPDKGAGYREAWRVLKPGGRFVFNVWDRIEANEFPHVVGDAVATLFPEDPPNFLSRIPYGYHDASAIREGLLGAGFERVRVDTVPARSRAPSPREPAIGFCQGTPLRGEIEARNPNALAEATEAAAEAIAARFGRGPVEGGIRAHVFTAVR